MDGWDFRYQDHFPKVAIVKIFSDFANEQRGLEGEKIRLDDVINRAICVISYRIASSKHNSGQYLTLQFKFTDEDVTRIFFTGSTVLAAQATKYAQEMPFEAMIKKIDRYYTFM